MVKKSNIENSVFPPFFMRMDFVKICHMEKINIYTEKSFKCQQLNEYGELIFIEVMITRPMLCYQLKSVTYNAFVANVIDFDDNSFTLKFWGERENLIITFSELIQNCNDT